MACQIPRTHARGLSIVELLIGIAIGLFVLAGATMVVSNQMVDNKRLLLETQVQQDMRAAMDIMVRDIRRSGYSTYADTLVKGLDETAVAPSVFRPAGFDPDDALRYSYAHNDSLSNNTLTAADERGFRLQGGKIEVLLGSSGYQALTDPNVVKITKFDINETENVVPLPTCSATPCASATCPLPQGQRIITRDIELVLAGEAVHDSRVKREVRTTVRVRNDEVCL